MSTITISTEDPAVAAGLIGGFLGTFIITLTIVIVFTIIAMWKIFVKAGEKGWKSLIPFYNAYILFKIVGMKKMFWYMIGASVLWTALFFMSGIKIDDKGNIAEGQVIPAWLGIASLAYMIFILYVDIKSYVRLAKAFGKSTAFAIGLILLEPIFILILGFDKSKYDKKIAKEC